MTSTKYRIKTKKKSKRKLGSTLIIIFLLLGSAIVSLIAIMLTMP